MNKFSTVIGFAGLNHLGLNTLAAAASKGYFVVGFHDNFKKISDLKKGNINLKEPGLKRLVQKHKKKINLSSNIKSLSSCDIIYISLDVPTNSSGKSNLVILNNLINKIKKVINKKVILVILSQVPPGFTRKIKWNKKKLFYQVETLVFGNAIKRALYPERIIIGCYKPRTLLQKKLNNYLKSFNCPILPMKYESAELTKISINAYLASTITVSNTLSEICEKIGADWSEIIPALKMDKRIGKYAYLNPGLGLSGGNLERDISTIIKYAKKYKTNYDSIKSWVSNSKYRKKWVWNTFHKLVLKKNKKPNICVLGLTYKENTNSIKNSTSIHFIKRLKKYKKIVVYDPGLVNNSINYPVKFARNLIEAIKGSDVLLILTPWKQFKTLKPANLSKYMKGRIVIDPYRNFDGDHLRTNGFTYSTLGK